MRKASCWMILVAVLCITAPTAIADSFSIVFTEEGGIIATPVDTSISVPLAGALDLGTVSIGASTYTFLALLPTSPTPQTDQYQWTMSDPLIFIITDTTTTYSADATLSAGTPVNGPGNGTATVISNVVATPEPSPVVLTLIGMGLLVVMRKRKALGLAQAT